MGKCSSVSFEQNPVEDTLAALHVQERVLYNKLCTVNLEMNSVWACWSFRSEYSVPFFVCVSVVVYKVKVLLRSPAERFWAK